MYPRLDILLETSRKVEHGQWAIVPLNAKRDEIRQIVKDHVFANFKASFDAATPEGIPIQYEITFEEGTISTIGVKLHKYSPRLEPIINAIN